MAARTTLPGLVENGDVVEVRTTTPNTYATEITGDINIGAIHKQFKTTTEQSPEIATQPQFDKPDSWEMINAPVTLEGRAKAGQTLLLQRRSG